MSARYPHGELRPAAGQRLNLEMTADCLRTFSHRHHAESGLWLVRGAFHAIEADSVVLHRHHAFAVRMIERNFDAASSRSEEHTSELQSHHDLVCRLLLE